MDSSHDNFDETGTMAPLDDNTNADNTANDSDGTVQTPKEITGRWSAEEHELFLQGTESFGKNWKRIASLIPNRSVVQIRTHAQKHFQKLEKINKLGKDGEHTGGRQVRADTMTDLDSGRSFKVDSFDDQASSGAKKVRAMTLGSAELGAAVKKLDNRRSLADTEHPLQAGDFLFAGASPALDGGAFNDASELVDAASGRARSTSNTSKRNIGAVQEAAVRNDGSFSPLGSDGISSPAFAAGAGNKGTTLKSPGRKTRVHRSKSFEELDSKGGKTSPNSVDGSSVRKGSKGSPRVARKAGGMKRSQSTSAAAEAACVDRYPFADYSPTSVLGSTMFGHEWRTHTHVNGFALGSSSGMKGGGALASTSDGNSIPSLFPDFDGIIDSMDIEEQGHQLQYVHYPDMPLGSMQEDMEYDDLTQSCKEMWGSGNGAILADQEQMFHPLSGFTTAGAKFSRISSASNSSSTADCGLTSESLSSTTSSGGNSSYLVPTTFEDSCLTDGFDELLY